MTEIEIALGALVTILGGGNVWNWLSSRGKTKVDLITLAANIAAETIKAQRDDRAELIERIDQLETKIDLMASHIAHLEDTIRSLGATPPPFPKAKPRR